MLLSIVYPAAEGHVEVHGLSMNVDGHAPTRVMLMSLVYAVAKGHINVVHGLCCHWRPC